MQNYIMEIDTKRRIACKKDILLLKMNGVNTLVSSQLLQKFVNDTPDNNNNNCTSCTDNEMLNKKQRSLIDNVTINVHDRNMKEVENFVKCDSSDGILMHSDDEKSKPSYAYRLNHQHHNVHHHFRHHRTVSDSVRLLNRNCFDMTEDITYGRREDFKHEYFGSLLLKSKSYHDENITGNSTTAIINGDDGNNVNNNQRNALSNSDTECHHKNEDDIDLNNYCTSNHLPKDLTKVSSVTAAITSTQTTATCSPSVIKRRSRFSNGKKTCYAICSSIKNQLIRTSLLTYIVPLLIFAGLISLAYFTRGYTQKLLYWIETQNYWIIFTIYILLFIVVSFPVVVGYLILMVTAGYLLGTMRGLLTVILGANIGIAVVHMTVRTLRYRLPLHKYVKYYIEIFLFFIFDFSIQFRIIKNDTGRAILRVISGPRAFRVVMFTRLTPIPFGLQNVIFAVCINTK